MKKQDIWDRRKNAQNMKKEKGRKHKSTEIYLYTYHVYYPMVSGIAQFLYSLAFYMHWVN